MNSGSEILLRFNHRKRIPTRGSPKTQRSKKGRPKPSDHFRWEPRQHKICVSRASTFSSSNVLQVKRLSIREEVFEYKVKMIVIVEIIIIQSILSQRQRINFAIIETITPNANTRNGSIVLTNVLKMKSLRPKKLSLVELSRQSYDISISELFPIVEALS